MGQCLVRFQDAYLTRALGILNELKTAQFKAGPPQIVHLGEVRDDVISAFLLAVRWYAVSVNELLPTEDFLPVIDIFSQRVFLVLKKILTRRNLEKLTLKGKFLVVLLLLLLETEVVRMRRKWLWDEKPRIEEKADQLLHYLSHQRRLIESRSNFANWWNGLIPSLLRPGFEPVAGIRQGFQEEVDGRIMLILTGKWIPVRNGTNYN
jgi:hypothetical protein